MLTPARPSADLHHFKKQFSVGKQGPVVQNIVSITAALHGQLVKCFTTLKSNILIFLLNK